MDGRHPPIIDGDLWQRVQDRLATRQTEPRNVNRKAPNIYMLKGLVRCSACGATLTYNRRYNSLQCHRYSKGQCSVSHFLGLEQANSAVVEYLNGLTETGAFRFSPAPAPAARLSHNWDTLIRSEEKRLARARTALLDGVFTSDEYRDVKEEIESALKRLRAEQAAEAQQAPPAPDPSVYRAKLREVVQIIKDPAASELAKNNALRSVIDKIVYNKPKGTFDFYFSPVL